VRLNPEKVGAGYGWVMGQYTLASNAASVQTIQNPISYQVVVLSPPASGVPTALAVEYVNIRTGPGTSYPILGIASPGVSAEVTGKSADGSWWQVKVPTQYSASGSGWVTASFVITQNTGNVPVVEAPAAPPTVEPTPPSTNGNGCSLVSQNPVDGTVFSPGASFSTTWVLKNTGTVKWDKAEVDARYLSAEANIPLHEGADHYDLTATVQPGETYDLTVPMVAPSDPGSYGELWELSLGSVGKGVTCQFTVYIQVK
jgi:uncharacterized protein YraI